MKRNRVLEKLIIGVTFFCIGAAAYAQSYVVESIKVPEDIRLEVGGRGFWPDCTLVMCTRRGEVWKNKNGRFDRYAFGLHEPLGLLTGKQGELWLMQRSELTHVTDEDGDGFGDSDGDTAEFCDIPATGWADNNSVPIAVFAEEWGDSARSLVDRGRTEAPNTLTEKILDGASHILAMPSPTSKWTRIVIDRASSKGIPTVVLEVD